MSERKRMFESKTQETIVRRLAPIYTPPNPEVEHDLTRQDSSNRVPADLKIDLLTRLIDYLKTL